MLVTENLLRYTPTKYYQNRPWFDIKLLQKIKWCSFLTHMVQCLRSYNTTDSHSIVSHLCNCINITSGPRMPTPKIRLQIIQNLAAYHNKVQTRFSAIAERPRCRVRYSFRQK